MEVERYMMLYELNEKEDQIRILGDEFVKSNYNKAKLVFNNRKFPLFSILPFDEIEEKKDKIKIELILNKNICNKSYMFKNCKFLVGLSINENSKIFRDLGNDESYYNEINSDFERKEKLSNFINRDIKDSKNYLNDVNNDYSEILGSENNNLDNSTLLYYKNALINLEKNYSILRGMFQNCSSIFSLPDISIYNNSNIIDMSFMFADCERLISLPDLSKWNTNNVTDLSGVFFDCSNLSSLPDISKWKTDNANNISLIFSGCERLSSLPDISKWKINNVTDIEGIFFDCSSLNFLPDISKWNTYNVTDMSFIFYNCTSLQVLPDISKWSTNNVS